MEPIMGFIMLWSSNRIPTGWAICDGSLLNISNNENLYSLIGTCYGGDGVNTFGIPNLTGRLPVGAGTGIGLKPYPLGQLGGLENVTITNAEMPIHNHKASPSQINVSTQASLSVLNAPSDQADPSNATLMGAGASTTVMPDGQTAIVQNYGPPTNIVSLPGNISLFAAGNPLNIYPSGNSQPHPNIQPVFALNYIICVQGIYPEKPSEV